MNVWQRMTHKQDPKVYADKDKKLVPSLRTIDLLALGIGIVVGTGIFTLPGIVAANHAGPAVTISFILGAIGAGMAALAYAEMSSVLPFAGSAFSWINVLFGEFLGWICGWALLAEYFVAVAFVASGWSAYMQGLLAQIHLQLPDYLAKATDFKGHGGVDILTVLIIVLCGFLISKGLKNVSRVENTLVVLKVLVILLFIAVGMTAVHFENYVPFIPPHKAGTNFGGWQGILAGTSQLFLVYIGFDAISANTAETKNPEKTMPRGILGTLAIGTTLFVVVSLVLVGMFNYKVYAGNAEPAAFALRKAGHVFSANVLSLVAIFGMLTGLIGMQMASSRLIYAFGRDGFLPSGLSKLDKHHNPSRALWLVTIAGAIVGGVLPFTFLSNLVSAGTLIAFIMVSLGIYRLRAREGVNLPNPSFKMPLYPVLPALSAIVSGIIFWELSVDAKWMMVIWLIIGIIFYFVYGIRHVKQNEPM
ncbi:amino acid permease [Lactobacillus sp. PV037]|uniref:APC family permease n=1 Tax=Lactobacillus sp. PV037 TaxID=2594496 RepID=UPI00224036FD|nr:amino acid permease [Lactobacillus sp. PV037]QNQ83991.1 amino acid permease [Lactobacillus sp. PV037]